MLVSLLIPERALFTETKVENGIFRSKCGTFVNLGNSGESHGAETYFRPSFRRASGIGVWDLGVEHLLRIAVCRDIFPSDFSAHFKFGNLGLCFQLLPSAEGTASQILRPFTGNTRPESGFDGLI